MRVTNIGTAWSEIIDQFVFNQCYPPWGASLSRGACHINIKHWWAFVQCSSFYSGRCDVTWAARVRSSWAKRSDGWSSKRAVTHMQRELNRRGWPQGEKAIERLNGKKRQHPTNRTTQQKLTQQHFLRFVFICHFETTQVSRIQEFSVFKLSFAVLDFFLFSQIFPLFSAGNVISG